MALRSHLPAAWEVVSNAPAALAATTPGQRDQPVGNHGLPDMKKGKPPGFPFFHNDFL